MSVRPHTLLLSLLLAGCGSDVQPQPTTTGPDLPDHNACLDEGEVMSTETCRAVVEADGRQPTTSSNVSGMSADPADPRLSDPDYQWLTAEIKRCTCVCCHMGSIGGPGVHRWNIEHTPMWIDTADGWTLSVLAGDTNEYEQTLPSSDPDRVRAVVERERERRGE